MTWALDPAPGDSVTGFTHLPVLSGTTEFKRRRFVHCPARIRYTRSVGLIPRCTAPKNIRYRVATVDRAPSEVVAAPGALLHYLSPKNLTIDHGCALGSLLEDRGIGIVLSNMVELQAKPNPCRWACGEILFALSPTNVLSNRSSRTLLITHKGKIVGGGKIHEMPHSES